MLNLTIEQVNEAIAKIEKAFAPEYRYAEEEDRAVCYYGFDLTRPGCIVGWIIWHTDAATFTEIASNPRLNTASVGTLIREGIIAVEGGYGGALHHALKNMQIAQDNCLTWGEAIRDYHDTLARVLARA